MDNYDMCVDQETLINISDKLRKIENDLALASSRMKNTIAQSENYLSGNQFEKAKQTTMECLKISDRTLGNLGRAKKYITELQNKLDEYGRCSYKDTGI